MNIIILGAGQVGSSLAEHLTAENHEITVVDINAEKLKNLQERLDIGVTVGGGSYPEILEKAGAKDADMVIAVTSNDEANIVACQVAYSVFNVPRKIARIRSPYYHAVTDLFQKEHIPIDVIIHPEELVTHYVVQLIMFPGALQVLDFANGKVKLIAVKAYYGGILLGRTLAELREYLPNVDARVAAIFRNDHSIPLEGSTVIEVGDEVFFVTSKENAHIVLSSLRRAEEPYKRVLIAGGGNIGFRLASVLEQNYQVKIIDHNPKRCEFLSESLRNTTILCADCCDKRLLIDENIEHVDVFCAVTNDDEDNIIACLQAKRLGAKQVMALVTRKAYVDLIEGGTINIAVSPQMATVGSILTHLRRGDVVSVHSLRRGAAEAIEAVAHGDKKTSKVVGRTLSEIKLPLGTTIGAIVRAEEVIIPHHDTVIHSEDHVILFVSNKKHIGDVEKLFQVGAGFF